MRVLVLAQGAARRWDTARGPFLGHPKHFVTVDGETVLARVCRLFAERGCEVVAVTHPDPRYAAECARADRVVSLDAPSLSGTNMDKFVATCHLWSTSDRTVIVWGDCYLTGDLVDQVVAHPSDGYHVWRRPGRSHVTGAKWDESFAVSFGPAEHDRVLATADRLIDLVHSGELVHPRAPGMDPTHIRTHLAAMNGVDVDDLDDIKLTATLDMQTHVDDWSDDFDTPWEWRTWMRRRFDHDGHRVGVCIPWTPGDTWRNSSFKWGQEWWNRAGLDVFVGSDPTGGAHPNRSAMRNDAARKAIAAGCDVLFFADSDTFVSTEQFWDAVHVAVHRRQLVFAFDNYVRVTRPSTVRLMRRGFDLNDRSIRHLRKRAYRSASHISGAFAIPTALFEQTGGYDERFTRWGYEDRAFHLAAVTFAGESARVHGSAFHWWHPPAVDRDRHAADSIEAARLARRYYLAGGWVPDNGAVMQAIEQGLIDPITEVTDPDPAAMRELLAEPGGPLDASKESTCLTRR